MARSFSRGSDAGVPSHDELLRRVEAADDIACDGMSEGGCRYCERVVETLRGGSIMCETCGHINAIGHSCADWREFDAGRLTLTQVDRRWKERQGGRRGEWVHLPQPVIDQLDRYPGVMIADRIRAALEQARAVDLEGARDG